VSKPRNPAQQFAEFFQCYAILPTPLHEALQEAAIQEGWTPPWDREEQAAAEQLKKRTAGKKSGLARAGLSMSRRSLVREAHARLKPAFRLHPSSIFSIRALHEEYLQLLDPEAKNLGFLVPFILAALSENDRKILRKVKRETLIKDLKALDIRSKRQQQ
jgi:hypothetical protein